MTPPSTLGHRTSMEMLYCDMVQLKVKSSPAYAPIQVHEALLRHHSAYFEAALGGHFAEAKKRVIELEDEDLDTVKRFVLWQYTKEYHPPSDVNESFNSVCKLWVFGDKRPIPLLSNMMINIFKDEIVKHWILPGASVIQYIYDNTPPNSKLRMFTIWVIAATGGPRNLTTFNQTLWAPEALFDLLKAVWHRKEDCSAKVRKDEFVKMDMCQWHQHKEEEKCSVKTE